MLKKMQGMFKEHCGVRANKADGREGKRGRSQSDPNSMGKEENKLVLCVQLWGLKMEHKDKLESDLSCLGQGCFSFTVPSFT